MIYAGLRDPVHVGPVPLRINLSVVVAPILLVALYRLRESISDPDARRHLWVALWLGVVAFAAAVVGLDLTLFVFGALYVGALAAFETAMSRLAQSLGAEGLADRWARVRRLTLSVGIGGVGGAATLAALDPSRPIGVVVGVASFLAVLVVLSAVSTTTIRTRQWLREGAQQTSRIA
jgi:hypothetical protein